MSRFLFAWEMGGGFGHIGEMLPIARTLRARGHQVIFVVRDLAAAERTLAQEGFALLPSPPWTPSPQPRGNPSINLAELLYRAGYSDGTALAGALRAWREIFRLVAPDLLVADYSPTALLAARGSGLTSVAIGIGFYLPPAASPMPSQQPWTSIAQSNLRAAEQLTLDSINGALAALDAAPLNAFSDLLACDEDFFCTFAELDHYGARPDVAYRGPIFTKMFGAAPSWPAGEGKRVFAFLHAKAQQNGPLFQQLRKLGVPTFAYVRGATDKQLVEIACETIHVTAEPIDLPRVIESCGAVICNGGHSTIASTLLAGRALVVVPQVIEQALMAYRLEQAGLAMTFGPKLRPERYGPLIEKLLAGSSHAQKAARFAEKYQAHDMDQEVEAIAGRCEEIAARQS